MMDMCQTKQLFVGLNFSVQIVDYFALIFSPEKVHELLKGCIMFQDLLLLLLRMGTKLSIAFTCTVHVPSRESLVASLENVHVQAPVSSK